MTPFGFMKSTRYKMMALEKQKQSSCLIVSFTACLTSTIFQQ